MQVVSNSVFIFYINIYIYRHYLYKYIIVGVKSTVKSMWGRQTEKASATESAVHTQSIG